MSILPKKVDRFHYYGTPKLTGFAIYPETKERHGRYVREETVKITDYIHELNEVLDNDDYVSLRKTKELMKTIRELGYALEDGCTEAELTIIYHGVPARSCEQCKMTRVCNVLIDLDEVLRVFGGKKLIKTIKEFAFKNGVETTIVSKIIRKDRMNCKASKAIFKSSGNIPKMINKYGMSNVTDAIKYLEDSIPFDQKEHN